MPRLNKAADREVDAAIGGRIKLRRKTLLLTQTEVGKHIGVTFQQLQKYENGTDRISASRLYRVSVLLRVPVDYFFEDIQESPPSKGDAHDQSDVRKVDMTASRDGVKLLRAFSRIRGKKTRMYIADLIDELAGPKV
ncbi:MAG TPA: helix-turn-helix transcriptional regulator [Rhizomicrobium sp.]